MFKTHKDSRIVQFHHNSDYGKLILGIDNVPKDIILQIEFTPHKDYDVIAEVVERSKYNIEEA